MDSKAPERPRRVHGRRLGRPLNASRQQALDELLPELSFPEDIDQAAGGSVNPADYFDQSGLAIWAEIGFGDGDHLARLMTRHPEKNFIGAEPYINGMSSFLKTVFEENLNRNRLRVWMDDAIALLDRFQDQSLERIYVLNPDPWPKARHHKRRIINQDNLDLFARLLPKDGLLIMTTDVDDLAEWMVTQASMHPAFRWQAEKPADWQTPPPDWVETKYEQKGRAAGRKQTYLFFERL